jgi:hypothetical protein
VAGQGASNRQEVRVRYAAGVVCEALALLSLAKCNLISPFQSQLLPNRRACPNLLARQVQLCMQCSV